MLPFPLLSCCIPCNSFSLPYQLLFQPVKVPFFLLVIFYVFPCGVCWEHAISSTEIQSSAPIQHLGTPCLVLSTPGMWAVPLSLFQGSGQGSPPSLACGFLQTRCPGTPVLAVCSLGFSSSLGMGSAAQAAPVEVCRRAGVCD